MSDRDICSWDLRLADQVKRNWNNYVRRRIDLSTARIDEMVSLAGEFLYVEEVSSDSALATIKLNRNTNDALDIRRGVVLKTIFDRLYISNDAQAGEWIDLIVGVNFDYRIPTERPRPMEAQPGFGFTLTLASTNYQFPAHPCNEVLLQASPDNGGGRIWVNFGADPVAQQCLLMLAGAQVVVETSNTDRVRVRGTAANLVMYCIYAV